MSDLHSFGLSRGARGVNDVSEMLNRYVASRRAGRLAHNLFLIAVNRDHLPRAGRKLLCDILSRDKHLRLSIAQHERQTFRRVAWVEGQICRAHLENG